MLRNVMCAVAVLGLSLGLAFAEPVKGKITAIEGGKLTAVVGADKKAGKAGESKTFDIAKGCKVCKMDGKNKVEVPGGLGADELKNLGKGVGATLEVNDGKVSEIILGGAKKKAAN